MCVVFAGVLEEAIRGAIIGGILGALAGLALLIARIFRKPKPCPDCQAPLPNPSAKQCRKMRLPARWQGTEARVGALNPSLKRKRRAHFTRWSRCARRSHVSTQGAQGVGGGAETQKQNTLLGAVLRRFLVFPGSIRAATRRRSSMTANSGWSKSRGMPRPRRRYLTMPPAFAGEAPGGRCGPRRPPHSGRS
jgi:hypothetical protein